LQARTRGQLTSLDERKAAAARVLAQPIESSTHLERIVVQIESKNRQFKERLADVIPLEQTIEIPIVRVGARKRDIQRRIARVRTERESRVRANAEAAAKPRAPSAGEITRRYAAIRALEAEIAVVERTHCANRAEIESCYEQKVREASKLMNERDENEKSRIAIDALQANIALASGLLTRVRETKRRAGKVKSEQQERVAVLKKANAQFAAMQADTNEKRTAVAKRDEQLARRARLTKKEEQNIEELGSRVQQLEHQVKEQEEQIAEYERKCDELNEGMRHEEEQLDKALFHASTLRVDSRIKRLQKMLETHTESTLTLTQTAPNAIGSSLMVSAASSANSDKTDDSLAKQSGRRSRRMNLSVKSTITKALSQPSE
jgi:chromosome segregation ATPase